MADRPVRIITKQTAVPGRIPTGTTGNEDNFIRQGEMAQNTSDKKLFGFNGSFVFEYGSDSFLSLTGGTVTGNTNIIGNLSANTLFSGSTNLYDIFSTTSSSDVTRVQPGLNTYTGGTGNLPTVNISALTISTLVASGSSQLGETTATSISGGTISGGTISGGTLFSGSTNLYNIFSTTDTNDITRVQPGVNTYTGGTGNFPTVNVSALTINTLIVSGTSQLDGTTSSSFSGGTISGGTIYSGSTNLYGIFLQKNGYLLQKAGMVTGSTFSGNPKKATVTFVTNFTDNNYAVNITGTINRTWTVGSKTLSGFTINANADPAFNSSEVYWNATESGEGYR